MPCIGTICSRLVRLHQYPTESAPTRKVPPETSQSILHHGYHEKKMFVIIIHVVAHASSPSCIEVSAVVQNLGGGDIRGHTRILSRIEEALHHNSKSFFTPYPPQCIWHPPKSRGKCNQRKHRRSCRSEEEPSQGFRYACCCSKSDST